MRRSWLLIVICLLCACRAFQRGDGEDLFPVRHQNVIVLYERGDVSDSYAVAIARDVYSHKQWLVQEWNTIYKENVPDFPITIKLLPRSRMTPDHPVVEMHGGVPVIRVAIGGGLGHTELHWICGELHNYYRWTLGLRPCYVEPTPECPEANSLWESTP